MYAKNKYAKNKFHVLVKATWQKDGWSITRDPLLLRRQGITDIAILVVSEVQARSITNYQLPITNARDLPHITEKGYMYVGLGAEKLKV